VCWPYNGAYNEALLCVFDGHGPQGEKIADLCVETLPKLLEKDRHFLRSDPAERLRQCLLEMDDIIFSTPHLTGHSNFSGTTATVVYARGDELWAAHCGDSRCVVGKREGDQIRVDFETEDHKCSIPAEGQRILSCGGEIRHGRSPAEPTRVVVHGAKGTRGLAMSRSLGDGIFKKVGVSAEPTVGHIHCSPVQNGQGDGHCVLVIASDGIWEFIESQEACNIAMAHIEDGALFATVDLVATAQSRWQKEEGSYRDDITAIVVYLPFLQNASKLDDESFSSRGSSAVTRSDKAGGDGAESTVLNGEIPKGSETDPAATKAADAAAQKPDVQTCTNELTTSEIPESDAGMDAQDGMMGIAGSSEFARRRLSVHIEDDEGAKGMDEALAAIHAVPEAGEEGEGEKAAAPSGEAAAPSGDYS